MGIGADMAANCSVEVQSADPWGILVTNAELTAFVDPGFGPELYDSTQVCGGLLWYCILRRGCGAS